MFTILSLAPIALQLVGTLISHISSGKTADTVVLVAQQLGLVTQTIENLQTQGRAETTAEEDANLVEVLGRRGVEDNRFDADLPKPTLPL